MKKPRHERSAFRLWAPLCLFFAKRQLLFTFTFLTAVLFHSGCSFTRTTSALSTPTSHEKKIPAEYDLTKLKDQKILVLVNQPAYLNAQANLRFHITNAINKRLTEKIKLSPECLVSYDELSEFRSNKPNFSLLSPVEVGAALDANMVLFVIMDDYQLNKMADYDYYKGFLSAQSVLFETGTGEKLWPESAKSKHVRVAFEIEQRGQEIAIKRLASACAHCIARYFYDCPKDKFKIFDDKSDEAWRRWK